MRALSTEILKAIESQHNRGAAIASLVALSIHRDPRPGEPIPPVAGALGRAFNKLLRGGVTVPTVKLLRRTRVADGMLTVSQVADRLGIDRDSVCQLIHNGQLSAANISSGKRATWRITPEALVAFLTVREITPPAAKSHKRRTVTTGVTQYF